MLVLYIYINKFELTLITSKYLYYILQLVYDIGIVYIYKWEGCGQYV